MWQELTSERIAIRRALLSAAAKWAGGLRGRWIAWLEFRELRKAHGATLKKVVGLWRKRDLAKLSRATHKLTEHAAHMKKMGRTVRRWAHRAMATSWRTWLVDFAFQRAGEMLRQSALHTRLGRAFTVSRRTSSTQTTPVSTPRPHL